MILAAVCSVALWDPNLRADLMHVLKLSMNAATTIASVWSRYYTGHVNKLREAVNSKCKQLELHEGWYLLSVSPPNIYVSIHDVG
jgi:hypothetical protein